MNSIAIAGAQGLIGNALCKVLAERGNIEKILALDLKKTGIKNTDERIINIYDKDLLVDTLKEVDLVVNLVAPYFRHGTIVADAAFKAGIHYTDACADVGIAEALLSKNDQWKDVGLTLITGLGASPGLSNLLVAKLGSKFDKLLEAHISWVTGIKDMQTAKKIEGLGTIINFIKEEFGEIPTFKDGKMIKVIGFKDGVETIYLDKKPCLVYHSGHSESITIPRYFSEIRTVTCKGNIFPFGLSQVFREALENGLNLEKIIMDLTNTNTPYKTLLNELGKHLDISQINHESGNFSGGLQVKVKGIKKGKERTKRKTLTGKRFNPKYLDLSADTAIPIAILSEEIISEKIKKRGAFAPESLGSKIAKKMYRKILLGYVSHYLKERKRVKRML